MINWNDSMSTGLQNIDAQHQEIIDKYNELYKAVSQSSSVNRIVAGDLLDFLQFYATWHFEREEKYMEQYQCPAAEDNKKAHAEFKAIFGNLYEEWQSTTMDIELVQETLTQVGEWIVNHILTIDTQLLPYVKDEG